MHARKWSPTSFSSPASLAGWPACVDTMEDFALRNRDPGQSPGQIPQEEGTVQRKRWHRGQKKLLGTATQLLWNNCEQPSPTAGSAHLISPKPTRISRNARGARVVAMQYRCPVTPESCPVIAEVIRVSTQRS